MFFWLWSSWVNFNLLYQDSHSTDRYWVYKPISVLFPCWTWMRDGTEARLCHSLNARTPAHKWVESYIWFCDSVLKFYWRMILCFTREWFGESFIWLVLPETLHLEFLLLSFCDTLMLFWSAPNFFHGKDIVGFIRVIFVLRSY